MRTMFCDLSRVKIRQEVQSPAALGIEKGRDGIFDNLCSSSAPHSPFGPATLQCCLKWDRDGQRGWPVGEGSRSASCAPVIHSMHDPAHGKTEVRVLRRGFPAILAGGESWPGLSSMTG